MIRLVSLALVLLACDYQPRPGSDSKSGKGEARPVPGATAIPSGASAPGDCSLTLAVQGMT